MPVGIVPSVVNLAPPMMPTSPSIAGRNRLPTPAARASSLDTLICSICAAGPQKLSRKITLAPSVGGVLDLNPGRTRIGNRGLESSPNRVNQTLGRPNRVELARYAIEHGLDDE